MLKYSIEFVKADFVLVAEIAEGYNKTRTVLQEEVSVHPYDPKNVSLVVNMPNAFLTQLVVNVVFTEYDEKTGRILNQTRPAEFQQVLDVVPNQIVLANLIGTLECVSEEDAYLTLLRNSIENEMQNRRLPVGGSGFYHIYVVEPSAENGLYAPEIMMEFPYLESIKEAVLAEVTP